MQKHNPVLSEILDHAKTLLPDITLEAAKEGLNFFGDDGF